MLQNMQELAYPLYALLGRRQVHGPIEAAWLYATGGISSHGKAIHHILGIELDFTAMKSSVSIYIGITIGHANINRSIHCRIIFFCNYSIAAKGIHASGCSHQASSSSNFGIAASGLAFRAKIYYSIGVLNIDYHSCGHIGWACSGCCQISLAGIIIVILVGITTALAIATVPFIAASARNINLGKF